MPTRSMLLFLFCGLLIGCPVYGPEPAKRQTEIPCVDDRGCPLDAYCDPLSSRCIGFDFELCITDGDCPKGSYCERPSGLCLVPDPAYCEQSSDCSPGFECDFRGGCRPRVAGSCLEALECEVEALCIENRCTPAEDSCHFDSQCALGASCLDHQCIFLCDQTGARCPSGTHCVAGLCEAETGQCTDSADCPDLRTHCVQSRCLFRCDAGCDERTETCDPDGFCRPRSLPDPDADKPSCLSDADCDGTVCREGLCRTPCTASAPDADSQCASFDAQLPICGPDNLCHAP